MLTLFVKLWKAALYDEMAVKRWGRGFLLWAGGMATSVLAFPIEVVQTWGPRDWAYRVAAAGALGIAGLVTAGQKNPTPEQLRAELGLPQPPGGTP